MPITQDQYTHEDLLSFVTEAQEVHAIWRPSAWYSEEMVDGAQWSEDDYQKALDAGIFDPGESPLTINRMFPTVQLLMGLQITNKFNTIAKGRTNQDTANATTMTEGIQFINDQAGTEWLISRAFKDSTTPGLGWLMCCHNRDPREEKITVRYRDWKEMWWDPMADPWLDPQKCRYAFHMPYIDLSELMAAFPSHKEELANYALQWSHDRSQNIVNIWYDEAQRVEDQKTMWSRNMRTRQRVRPVQMWYPVWTEGQWASFENGDARCLDPMIDEATKLAMTGNQAQSSAVWQEISQMVAQAVEIVKTSVKRMWTTTFLDDIVLYDGITPFSHDMYPFVPFVGYLDRFGFPFGAIKQIIGQQVEINKRRAMALALLRKRRVVMEQGVAGDKNQKDNIDNLTKQANRLDGVMVLANGGHKFEVIEGTDKNQLQAQVLMLHESEAEINEISGANREQRGYKSGGESGIALQEKKQSSSVILSPLFENLRRSRWMLGKMQIAEIQGQWKGPKILRVTDRMRGVERFLTLNQKKMGPQGIEIVNNITQGKFDFIVADAPATDTVREQNLILITEAVKKSPPEIIPQLITMAFEMSALPNKDMLVAKLQQIYHLSPEDSDMSPEEAKQQTVQILEAHQKQQQAEGQYQGQIKQLTIQNLSLENQLLQAKIAKIMGDSQTGQDKIDIMRKDLEQRGFKIGADVGNSRVQTRANAIDAEHQRNMDITGATLEAMDAAHGRAMDRLKVAQDGNGAGKGAA